MGAHLPAVTMTVLLWCDSNWVSNFFFINFSEIFLFFLVSRELKKGTKAQSRSSLIRKRRFRKHVARLTQGWHVMDRFSDVDAGGLGPGRSILAHLHHNRNNSVKHLKNIANINIIDG